MRLNKKLVAAGVGTALALALGGVALAYWTSTGSGSGTASAGSSDTVTITQTSTAITNLGPGVAAQPLSGTFTVAHPAYVGQVTVAVASTDKSGCTASDFTLVQPAATNAEISTGSTWGGASIAFNDKPLADQNACQGATVMLSYSSN